LPLVFLRVCYFVPLQWQTTVP